MKPNDFKPTFQWEDPFLFEDQHAGGIVEGARGRGRGKNAESAGSKVGEVEGCRSEAPRALCLAQERHEPREVGLGR